MKALHGPLHVHEGVCGGVRVGRGGTATDYWDAGHGIRVVAVVPTGVVVDIVVTTVARHTVE